MKLRLAAGAAALLAVVGCTSSGSHKAIQPGPTNSASSSPSAHYTAPPAVLPVPGTTVAMSTAPAPWPAPVLVAQGRDSAAYVAASVESELGDAVLFVDDLQWADTQTASLLPLLAGRVPLVVALRRSNRSDGRFASCEPGEMRRPSLAYRS